MPFRWPPPAFPVVVLLALFVIPTAVLGGYSRSQAPWVWLAAALLGAIILAVIAQWAMHRDGVHDWQHGGVAYIVHDDRVRLAWVDRAVLVTRRGSIHAKAGRLRLETRALCGLIPLSVDERVLSPADRAHSSHRAIMQGARLGPTDFTDYVLFSEGDPGLSKEMVRCEHAVDLRTEAGDSVRLIDLASRGLQGNTQGFIDRLERRVNECVAAIQRAPRRAS
jgi:hypothetical protein